MTNDTQTGCVYCQKTHDLRWLCDPAKKVLDALVARGMSFTMPDVEFPTPVPIGELGLGLNAADSLLVQLVVQAATVPAAGHRHPVLMFTGRDHTGAQLPRWLYAGTPSELRQLVGLVERMAVLAIRTAGQSGVPR